MTDDYQNELVTRSAPRWAWEIIDETLEIDSVSKAFDPDLRARIAQAYEAMLVACEGAPETSYETEVIDRAIEADKADQLRENETMFTLKIETDNAAFNGNMRGEIARILYELSDDIVGTSRPRGKLKDENGNTVGDWTFTASSDPIQRMYQEAFD